MQRLIVVADNSLIFGAIAIGLRDSGEFKLVAHVDASTASARTILDLGPDVVLIDDMDQSEPILHLIREIEVERPQVAVIVLMMVMDAQWLESLFDAGATAAISKAAHPLALATLVRETISRHVVYRYKELDRPPVRTPGGAAGTCSDLTTRELEVLRLVAAGSTNGEIARDLWVTEQTVKFHLSNVYRKLEVTNRTEASHYAHVNGLLARSRQLMLS
jgi:DNA-binding NarL/FixJ family response regulator